MDTLFPLDPIGPPGFTYIPDFIDFNQEQELLNEISKIKLETFVFKGFEAKRKVASFGFDYSFDNNALLKGKKIPSEFNGIVEKVAKKCTIPITEFTELLITEYPPGAVINWHRDAYPFDIIAGISLLSDCIFKLRPFEKSKQQKGSVINIKCKRRSLYLIRGEARANWQHSISPVKETRYSITFRTLKGNSNIG